MSQPILWLLGLLGVAVLSLGCLFAHAPAIEADLTARASGALGGAQVDVSGRTLTLTGTVPDNASRLSLLASARGIPGVARVIDGLTVAGGGTAATAPAASRAFSLMASGASGPIVVRGAVSSESAREAILDRLRAAFPGREIQDEMTVASGADADWEASVFAMMPLLGDVSAPSMTAENGVLVLRGTVASEEIKARVEAAAAAAVLSPYTFRSELIVAGEDASGGQVEASGSSDENVQGAEAALREALSIGAIEFESGTNTLTARSREILDAAAEVFARFPSVAAEVQGHTDSQGGDAANQALSQTRAEAVRDYLTGKGATSAQLTPRGYGETEPIADNDTAEGRARNRRVVFSLRTL